MSIVETCNNPELQAGDSPALVAPGCDTQSHLSAYSLLSHGDEVFTDSASLKSITPFASIMQRPSICLKLSFHAHSPAFS